MHSHVLYRVRVNKPSLPTVPPAYALHRTIGDDMDIFTSAADIPLDDTVLSERECGIPLCYNL